MNWLTAALVGLGVLLLVLAILWTAAYYYVKNKFLDKVLRIFQEKPLFIVPQGKPIEDAEDVTIQTEDGYRLAGCYLPTHTDDRKGVILFGLEFGSNRWACVPYCDFLRRAGYDIFAVEFRNQGDSARQPNYEPLQWVTEYEVRDMRAAIDYLLSRPDRDEKGIGFFGISKGAGAGVMAAADRPEVRCFVTDGMFATHSTMVPYMQKWLAIYSDHERLRQMIPKWYFAMFAHIGLRKIAKARNCRFPHLERYLPRLNRPLFMIHGGRDVYIKPEMAQYLYEIASQPKELWIVENAKHNQSFHVANGEYQDRVLRFFDRHLAGLVEQEHVGSQPQVGTSSPVEQAAN